MLFERGASLMSTYIMGIVGNKSIRSFPVLNSLLCTRHYAGNGLPAVLCAENGTSGHQPVSSTLSHQVRVVGTDPAVDLDVKRRELLAQVTHLVHHAWYELLAPESRFDSHYQHLVNVASSNQLIDSSVQRSFGVKSDTDFHISLVDEFANLLEIAVFTLIVESEAVSSCLRHQVNVVARIGDNHMAVEMGRGQMFPQPGHHTRTDRQVLHEMSS